MGGPAREERPQTLLRVQGEVQEGKALAAIPHPFIRPLYVAILRKRVRMEPRKALRAAGEAAANMR